MIDIKKLCQMANISQQTFYRLSRENEEFRDIVIAHRVKKGNGFKYDEAVLNWLCSHYDIETPADSQPNQTSNADPASNPSETPPETAELQEKIRSLTETNEALEREISALQAKLLDAEQERKLLIGQNAQLTLLLGQEKQEKQALLPAPRKALLSRIKDIFKKETPEN